VEFNRFEGLKLVHINVHSLNFVNEERALTSRSSSPYLSGTVLDHIVTKIAIIVAQWSSGTMLALGYAFG